MGLDMYLFKTDKHHCPELCKKIFDVKMEYEKEALRIGEFLLFHVRENEPNPITKMNPSVYWRKANHIHMWFSKNVLGNKNGKEINKMAWVNRNQLQMLIQQCQMVLDHCKTASGEVVLDESYCRKMFPPCFSIVFGGSTEYDEDFIHDLKYTITQVTALLMTTNFEKEAILYYAYY